MKEHIKITYITAMELPTGYYFKLIYLLKIEWKDFVLFYDEKKDILYVNKDRVTEEEVKGFQAVIEFEGPYLCDIDSPVNNILEHVYVKFGSNNYILLVKANQERQKERRIEKAAEEAPEIVGRIEKELIGGNISLEDVEHILCKVWSAGNKTERKTPDNMINYGTVYTFMFGYLLGKGKIGGINGARKKNDV